MADKFPTSPSDGEQHTNSLGTIYQYLAVDNKWYIITVITHNSLDGLNDGVDYEHISADQVAALHAESHNIVSHDTTATGANLNTLVGGGETDLHSHAGGVGGGGGTKDLILDIMPRSWRTGGDSEAWWNIDSWGGVIQHGSAENARVLMSFVVPDDYVAGTNINFSHWIKQAVLNNHFNTFNVKCEQIADGDAQVAWTAYNDYIITNCVPTIGSLLINDAWIKFTWIIDGGAFTMIPGNLIQLSLRMGVHYSSWVYSNTYRATYTWE